VFHQEFPYIRTIPEVIFPGIQTEAYDKAVDLQDESVKQITSKRPTLVSINRFERKKNIGLALDAYNRLADKKPRLVIAGGYDDRVRENVEHHAELLAQAERLGLSTWTWKKDQGSCGDADVVFIPSFSENQRTFLLSNSLLLIYTPSNEHFGIVPTEAMYAGVPVVAVNSGGPLESILQGETGLLRPPDADAFAEAFTTILSKSASERQAMGQKGRTRVKAMFSVDAMVDKIERILTQLSEQHQQVSWLLYAILGIPVYLVYLLMK
jgi:alpha-1,3/alpha-1,6-mannosyltransferase